jgi:Uma2 family endonuclease
MISIIEPLLNKILAIQKDKLIIIEGGSWDDYWNISHEDIKVEFIGESIYIHSPANLDDEDIFGHLLSLFRSNIMNNHGKILGSRFPVRLKDGKRVEPDLFYVQQKQIDEEKLTKTVLEGSPLFIIEIVSPSYRSHDTIKKVDIYQDLGVKEYWIVDPELLELRRIIFKEKEIFKDTLFTEGTISPSVDELNHIKVNITELWQLIRKNQVNNE